MNRQIPKPGAAVHLPAYNRWRLLPFPIVIAKRLGVPQVHKVSA
jgi:hypothetical protein